MRTSSGQAAQAARQAESKARGEPAGGQRRDRVAAVHNLVLWAAPLSTGGRGDFRDGVTAEACTGPGTRFMFSGVAACSACAFDDAAEQCGAGLAEFLAGLQVSQCAGALP